MNREAMIATRDRIASAGDTHCKMDSWIGGKGRNVRITLNDKDTCGTTGCIAGHTIAVATGSFVGYLDESGEVDEHYDGYGNLVDPEAEAARILGLSESAAAELFLPWRWPAKFAVKRLEEGDAKGMVEFLDAIIDGLYVWNEELETWEPLDTLEKRLAAEFDDDEAK